jgi:hypothetical protein
VFLIRLLVILSTRNGASSANSPVCATVKSRRSGHLEADGEPDAVRCTNLHATVRVAFLKVTGRKMILKINSSNFQKRSQNTGGKNKN